MKKNYSLASCSLLNLLIFSTLLKSLSCSILISQHKIHTNASQLQNETQKNTKMQPLQHHQQPINLQKFFKQSDQPVVYSIQILSLIVSLQLQDVPLVIQTVKKQLGFNTSQYDEFVVLYPSSKQEAKLLFSQCYINFRKQTQSLARQQLIKKMRYQLLKVAILVNDSKLQSDQLTVTFSKQLQRCLSHFETMKDSFLALAQTQAKNNNKNKPLLNHDNLGDLMKRLLNILKYLLQSQMIDDLQRDNLYMNNNIKIQRSIKSGLTSAFAAFKGSFNSLKIASSLVKLSCTNIFQIVLQLLIRLWKLQKSLFSLLMKVISIALTSRQMLLKCLRILTKIIIAIQCRLYVIQFLSKKMYKILKRLNRMQRFWLIKAVNQLQSFKQRMIVLLIRLKNYRIEN